MGSKRLRGNTFISFYIFVILLRCELCAQSDDNSTSGVDVVTLPRYSGQNETATPVVADAISGHATTGSFQSRYPEMKSDSSGIRTHNTETERNNSAITIQHSTVIPRNPSEETKNSDQNPMDSGTTPGPNQTQNPREIQRIPLSTLLSIISGRVSISRFQERDSESTISTETLVGQYSSRNETEQKSTALIGTTKEIPAEESTRGKSSVPEVPSDGATDGTATFASIGQSLPGHRDTSLEEGGSEVLDVITDVTTKAEFVYRNLWEEVEVNYDDAETRDSSRDGNGNEGEEERTGTRTETTRDWRGGESQASNPGSAEALKQSPEAEIVKTKEYLGPTHLNERWQDRMSVLVPVMCGMFGAMFLVLAAYFLRNCPRNIGQFLTKAQTPELKRRKSDLNLLIDNSSGDERP